MKVFILGLDGLEYDFVEKWNLSYLKQRQYGKINVPINQEVGHPTSPEVWATFLTGKHQQLWWKDSTTLPKTIIKRFLTFLREHVNVSLSSSLRNRTPWQLRHHKEFPELDATTFLDVTKSLDINVPYYSYDGLSQKLIRYLYGKGVGNIRTLKIWKALYERRKQEILETISQLENDVEVVFAFIHEPDLIQHYCLTKPRFVKQFYYDLDYSVYELKDRVPTDVLFLIVSDHGFSFETGTHSHHGFYSSNQPLTPKPTNITHFYHIITNETK